MQIFEQLSWLWISVEVLGTLAVIVGVWGEEHFDHKVLPYFKQERLKSRFWVILLVGLAIELIGVVGTTLTSIALEERVEVLRKSNLELQAKMQPRAINLAQRDRFISLLKDSPKEEVVVTTASSENETINYSFRIRAMLDQAGYGSKNYPKLLLEPREQNVLLFQNNDASLIITVQDGFHPPRCATDLKTAFEAIGIKTAGVQWTDTNGIPWAGNVVVTVKERN